LLTKYGNAIEHPIFTTKERKKSEKEETGGETSVWKCGRTYPRGGGGRSANSAVRISDESEAKESGALPEKIQKGKTEVLKIQKEREKGTTFRGATKMGGR